MNILNSLGLGGLAGSRTTSSAHQAQQLFNQTYSQYAQQGMNSQLGAQQRQFNQDWVERRYMIDGKHMTLTEFVNFIWPEDCADKTFFLLKHTKET